MQELGAGLGRNQSWGIGQSEQTDLERGDPARTVPASCCGGGSPF